MPLYSYQCINCGSLIELRQSRPEMVRCQRCEGQMQFLFPVVNLHTNKTFVANRDDGFGLDNRGRKRAYAKAKAQGISTSGKFWSPQLNSWIGGKDDVVRICQQRGLTCEGSVNYKPPEKDPPPEKAYEVAPDIVQKEVQEIKTEHGHEMTAKELHELPEATKERLSGVW